MMQGSSEKKWKNVVVKARKKEKRKKKETVREMKKDKILGKKVKISTSREGKKLWEFEEE